MEPAPPRPSAAPRQMVHAVGWLAHRGPLHTYDWRARWCVLTEAGIVDYKTDSLAERLSKATFGPEARVSMCAAKDAPGEAAKYRRGRPFSFVVDMRPSGGPKRKLIYYDACSAKMLAAWLAGFRSAGVAVATAAPGCAGPGAQLGGRQAPGQAKVFKVCPTAAPECAEPGAQLGGRQAPGQAPRRDDPFHFARKLTQRRPGHLDDYFEVDGEMLGEGAYGCVWKVVDKGTGAIRVIKSIDTEKLPNIEMFEEEVRIQQAMDHPNIVKLYEVFRDAKRYYLVLEMCSGGELFDRIIEQVEARDGGNPFDAACCARYMLQILGGVCYMHSQGCAHRDLKPENFIFQSASPDSCIKIIDFGLARRCGPGGGMSSCVGTAFYMAPEVAAARGAGGAGAYYGERCDVWSCGVIAYILLCGKPPFHGRTDDEVLSNVMGGSYGFPSPGWDGVPSSARDFVAMALTFNPKMRPSASDLLKHDWLTRADVSSGHLTTNFASALKSFRSTTRIEKIALTFIAHTLREEEIRELKDMFMELDENNDGTLTAREITQVFRNKGLEPPADLYQALSYVDTDGSGVIDYTEFIAASLASKRHITEEVLWNTFRIFDKDMSGEITMDELGQVLNSEDEAVQRAIIDEADGNGDGRISFEEFCGLMRRNKRGSVLAAP